MLFTPKFDIPYHANRKTWLCIFRISLKVESYICTLCINILKLNAWYDWAKYYYKSLGRVDFTFFSRGVLSSFGHMEDTANIFVVNALICQNLIRSSCRRCMKAYFCVKKRTKGSFILSYISYSIKSFICYVEWYHINVWIDDILSSAFAVTKM